MSLVSYSFRNSLKSTAQCIEKVKDCASAQKALEENRQKFEHALKKDKSDFYEFCKTQDGYDESYNKAIDAKWAEIEAEAWQNYNAFVAQISQKISRTKAKSVGYIIFAIVSFIIMIIVWQNIRYGGF